MKTLVIFLCSLCLMGVRADDAEGAPNSCLQKLGISMADLPKLMTDQSEESVMQRGCLEACYLQKLGFMENNVINLQAIEAEMERTLPSDKLENVRELVRRCAADTADDNECMAAQKFSQCAMEELRMSIRKAFQHMLP
ncbi:general odorant-binding protein 28a-like [Calliopsis andreniformis]|uniref:general odorant-binding protein 28a-like n=1 Tax=Calliopsis andreniformis TaxID=337506 RepID=UPI003FCCD235